MRLLSNENYFIKGTHTGELRQALGNFARWIGELRQLSLFQVKYSAICYLGQIDLLAGVSFDMHVFYELKK